MQLLHSRLWTVMSEDCSHWLVHPYECTDLSIRSQQHFLLSVKIQVDDQRTKNGVPLITLWETGGTGQTSLLDVSETQRHTRVQLRLAGGLSQCGLTHTCTPLPSQSCWWSTGCSLLFPPLEQRRVITSHIADEMLSSLSVVLLSSVLSRLDLGLELSGKSRTVEMGLSNCTRQVCNSSYQKTQRTWWSWSPAPRDKQKARLWEKTSPNPNIAVKQEWHGQKGECYHCSQASTKHASLI